MGRLKKVKWCDTYVYMYYPSIWEKIRWGAPEFFRDTKRKFEDFVWRLSF